MKELNYYDYCVLLNLLYKFCDVLYDENSYETLKIVLHLKGILQYRKELCL